MYDLLTALIRKTETGKTDPAVQYETIIGHNQRHLDKPLTQMTVDEIIAASDSWRKRFKTTSGAAGAYQIIKPTLVQLKKDLSLTGSEKFTPALQDRMGEKLCQKRGADQFLAGALSLTAFGNNLAREWASFPVLSPTTRGKQQLKRGQSYYDKFAGNHALVSPGVVEGVLAQMLKERREVPGQAAPVPLPDAPTEVVPAETTAARPTPLGFMFIIALIVIAVITAWWFFGR
jgi:muramidase (phage lysozyme)